MQWKVENNRFVKTFDLANFVACVNLLNKITAVAEEMNHHPDISITSYNRMQVSLYTHDANAITALDYELAERIDELFQAEFA